jgi:hypothetical protein
MVRITHVIPGRLRLRLEATKGRPELATELHSQLAAVSGIDRVEIDTRTGSLLLLYDPSSLRSPDFLDSLSQALGRLFPAHFAPGHLHVTVRRLKGRPELARRIEQLLEPVWGIHNIKINPSTGSCHLAYDSHAVTSAEFVEAVADALGPLLPKVNLRKLILRTGLRLSR